jgi:murein L,D-transpeptidase YafK
LRNLNKHHFPASYFYLLIESFITGASKIVFILFLPGHLKLFMRLLTILLFLLFSGSGMAPQSFREKQMVFTRVREAYTDKEKSVIKTLSGYSISRDSLRIYLRAFKTEKTVELWAKNISDSVYTLIREFPICDISGNIGPKRRYRDLQVPEGFYYISDLNPYSKYYLSMQINYPNASDSIRGVYGHLGNYIFIHGECISSGCIAIANDKIKELFVFCIEAYNSGQEKIDFTIFPARLNDSIYSGLTKRYSKDKDKISLWADLKKGYDLFVLNRVPPSVKFLPDGTHDVN